MSTCTLDVIFMKIMDYAEKHVFCDVARLLRNNMAYEVRRNMKCNISVVLINQFNLNLNNQFN